MRGQLVPLGVAFSSDGGAMERLVWLRVQTRRLQRQLESEVENGFSYDCGSARQQLPEIGILNKWFAELRQLETAFGLTPAARASLKIEPSAKDSPGVVARQRKQTAG